MSDTYDWLIAGLGNPGRKYENTRHNVGWMAAEKLISKYRAGIKINPIYYYSSLKIHNKNILVVMPTTYMNASGEAVRKIANKYKLTPSQIIVISDEYNFPVGKIHLRQGGSDGGHNGLTSIIEELETANFYRLRCGIGRNFTQGGLVDYVLSTFTESESEALNLMLEKTVESIEHICRTQINRAMSDINSEKLWNKSNNDKNKELKDENN